jgi:hypothetical protein
MRSKPARDKAFAALQKTADEKAEGRPQNIAPAQPQPKPEPAPKPETEAPETETTAPETDTEAPAPETNQPKPETEAPAAADGKKPKPNPWKLYEESKKKIASLEQQISEAKSTSLAEQERKQLSERADKAEARAKEYEDHLRFTDYQQSQEFKDKYEKPYTSAWNRAMNELSGLGVPTDDAGGTRPFTTQDMLQLVNADTIPARKMANELYGDFANEVMLQRNEIRRMADEQNAALDDAKKNGAERIKQQQETSQKTRSEINEHIKTSFKGAIESFQKDEANARFFTAKEGDEDWNSTLERSKQFSASVFTENPEDPKLTPQQRAEIVKKHAAIFNRSSAFPLMKRTIIGLEKQLAEAKKELEGFKGSRPDAGAPRPAQPNGNGQPARAKDRIAASFQDWAKTHAR